MAHRPHTQVVIPAEAEKFKLELEIITHPPLTLGVTEVRIMTKADRLRRGRQLSSNSQSHVATKALCLSIPAVREGPAGLNPTVSRKSIMRGYGEPHAHDFGWGVSREEQVRHLIHAAAELADDGLCHVGRAAPVTPHALFNGVPGYPIAPEKCLGYTLAIITSKPEAPLFCAYWTTYNVRRFFTTHRAPRMMSRHTPSSEREKPHPDMLHSVMRELKFAPAMRHRHDR